MEGPLTGVFAGSITVGFRLNGWVPHINGVKHDNEPANLIAVPVDVHNKIHGVERRDGFLVDRAVIEQMLKCYKVATGPRPIINIQVVVIENK